MNTNKRNDQWQNKVWMWQCWIAIWLARLVNERVPNERKKLQLNFVRHCRCKFSTVWHLVSWHCLAYGVGRLLFVFRLRHMLINCTGSKTFIMLENMVLTFCLGYIIEYDRELKYEKKRRGQYFVIGFHMQSSFQEKIISIFRIGSNSRSPNWRYILCINSVLPSCSI